MVLRRSLPFVCFVAFSVAALAQTRAVSTNPDLFVAPEGGFTSAAWRDINAKTLGTQTINTGVQNCIFIAAGQSNMQNVAPSAFTLINPNSVDNLNIYDGAIYKAADPLLGTPLLVGGTGNPIMRLADALVTAAKCSRVIIESIAIGATKVADWDTGALTSRLPAAMRRLAQRLNQNTSTVQCGNTNVTCVVLWGQGESDNTAGTSQSAYTNSLNDLIAVSNTTATALGWTSGTWARWLVAKQTWISGAASATIQAAQAAVVTGVQVFTGANADALTGSICGAGANAACRQADNTHWSDAGSFSYAGDATNGWQQALHASGAPF